MHRLKADCADEAPVRRQHVLAVHRKQKEVLPLRFIAVLGEKRNKCASTAQRAPSLVQPARLARTGRARVRTISACGGPRSLPCGPPTP